MIAEEVESSGDFLVSNPCLAEFLSVDFRLLVPALGIEVILGPLRL